MIELSLRSSLTTLRRGCHQHCHRCYTITSAEEEKENTIVRRREKKNLFVKAHSRNLILLKRILKGIIYIFGKFILKILFK